MFGIDPQGHAGARLAREGQAVDALELPLRLGVDRLDAQIDRLHELGFRLADAGEHDLGGDEPRPQRDVDLAAGIGVGGCPQAAQEAGDREGRVRLQRVVQRVRIRGEGLVDGPVAGGDDGRAVDVKRGAFAGGDLGERHAVAGKRTLWSVESGHVEKFYPNR